MMISRAIINKMNADGTCSIKIPAQAESMVTAYICVQKGTSIHYAEGEVVYAAQLGEHDWVILGIEYQPKDTEQLEALDTVKINNVYSNSGKIGDDTILGNTGMKVKDLWDMKLGYINIIANLNKDIQQ